MKKNSLSAISQHTHEPASYSYWTAREGATTALLERSLLAQGLFHLSISATA